MTKCRCGHAITAHYPRRGKWLCGSMACGCAEPRPDTRIPTQHRDDDWDDSVEPRRRMDMGAHEPSEWVEPWEVAE